MHGPVTVSLEHKRVRLDLPRVAVLVEDPGDLALDRMSEAHCGHAVATLSLGSTAARILPGRC